MDVEVINLAFTVNPDSAELFLLTDENGESPRVKVSLDCGLEKAIKSSLGFPGEGSEQVEFWLLDRLPARQEGEAILAPIVSVFPYLSEDDIPRGFTYHPMRADTIVDALLKDGYKSLCTTIGKDMFAVLNILGFFPLSEANRPKALLGEIYQVYAGVWQVHLDKSNFRRKLLSIPGLLEHAEELTRARNNTPASLYYVNPRAMSEIALPQALENLN